MGSSQALWVYIKFLSSIFVSLSAEALGMRPDVLHCPNRALSDGLEERSVSLRGYFW
jgi:hypothetical protein